MAGTKVKIVVVGDGCVGKTSLLVSYRTSMFPVEYVPTVFDNFCQAGGGGWAVDKPSAVGHGGAGGIRPTALSGLSNTDLFMLCFSLDRPSSLKHVKEMWFPEVRDYGTSIPIVLVGTKLDLRLDTASSLQQSQESSKSRQLSDQPVTYKQGKAAGRDIGAKCYFECSALTQENVRDVFLESVRVVIDPATELYPSVTSKGDVS